METVIAEVTGRLRRQGLDEAARHMDQAWSALQRSEWEGANAQTRSSLESLFNRVAALRLRTNSRDGKARKELEEKGILRKQEARLVQDFIDVAGGAGSHAGVSNSDEARGRLLAAAGIAYIGLALIPDLVRVEDVISERLEAAPGTRLPVDAEIDARCPTCGETQKLAEATLTRDGDDTVYECKNGCQPIVVVSPPDAIAWPGRGYRIGDLVIRNASELSLPMRGEEGIRGVLKIPASPAALMKNAT